MGNTTPDRLELVQEEWVQEEWALEEWALEEWALEEWALEETVRSIQLALDLAPLNQKRRGWRC